MPDFRLKLKMWAKGFAIEESMDLSKSRLMPSISLLFFGSIDFRMSQIRTGPISSKVRVGILFFPLSKSQVLC